MNRLILKHQHQIQIMDSSDLGKQIAIPQVHMKKVEEILSPPMHEYFPSAPQQKYAYNAFSLIA